MFYNKINFRKKILLVLLLFLSVFFLIFILTDVIFINTLKKDYKALDRDYTEYLTRILEEDNQEKEEIF